MFVLQNEIREETSYVVLGLIIETPGFRMEVKLRSGVFR